MRIVPVVVAVAAVLVAVSNLLKVTKTVGCPLFSFSACGALRVLPQARDDAVLMAAIAKRAPVPSYARMTTISHSAETMAKVASAAGRAPESFAPSFGALPLTSTPALLLCRLPPASIGLTASCPQPCRHVLRGAAGGLRPGEELRHGGRHERRLPPLPGHHRPLPLQGLLHAELRATTPSFAQHAFAPSFTDTKKLLHRTTARTAARRTARASSPRSCSVTR